MLTGVVDQIQQLNKYKPIETPSGGSHKKIRTKRRKRRKRRKSKRLFTKSLY
jgi:hypothetical protein